MNNNSNGRIKLVVFDLDGTLTKSDKSILKSMRYALDKMGIDDDIDIPKFQDLIGHHFRDIFSGLGIDVPDLASFINEYKTAYKVFISESRLYEGVLDILSWLKNENYKTALLTTKLQDQADVIIDHFQLRDYFDSVVGRREGVAHKPAPDQYLMICKELSVDPVNSLMVGDTELDIRCGKNASALTCAVSFGFRKLEEIEKENPDYIIHQMIHLKNVLKLHNGHKNEK
ncbi:MAG: HAD family hydrolase [Melioribacteraceae bacterium]|nr:HAD family hydrolase [Melioribacteraceae bacterium]